MKEQGSGSSRKIANNLLALSSAAVLTVYSAGYVRTKAAAERFAAPASQRRTPARPSPVATGTPAPGASVSPTAAAPPAPPPPVAVAPSTIAAEHHDAGAAAPRAAASSPAPVAEAATKSARESTAASTALSAAPKATPAPSAAATKDAPAAVAVQTAVEPPVVTPPPAPPPPQWKDGMYSGWGFSRHGDIQAVVVIEHGKVTSAGISQCLTRYPCTIIEHLPPQVVARQNPDVDYVAGATESADAFFDAVFEALGKAK